MSCVGQQTNRECKELNIVSSYIERILDIFVLNGLSMTNFSVMVFEIAFSKRNMNDYQKTKIDDLLGKVSSD